MKLAIDASRNRSGGAIVHIINILKYFDPKDFAIKQIHIWAYQFLLDQIPDYPWLVKHTHKAFESSLLKQLHWQYFILPKKIKEFNCSLLFSLDAGSVCRSTPYITMCRDMLSFDKKEFRRYFPSRAWLRLYILRYVQLHSFKKALATIFLTECAKSKIAEYQNIAYQHAVINHGISNEFRINKNNKGNLLAESEITLTYVSNADLYKHNWNVIAAVWRLRCKYNLNLQLRLVGAREGYPAAIKKIDKSLLKFDKNSSFVLTTPKISHKQMMEYFHNTDLLIFASTCENMPNTLIEGMSTGIPIVCSNYGPMPEIIKDGTVYIDPEDIASIEDALYKMISNDELRLRCAKRSYDLSLSFSWQKCSTETFTFINNKLINGGKQ